MSIVRNKNMSKSGERKSSTGGGIRVPPGNNGMRKTYKAFKAPSSMKYYGGFEMAKKRPRTIRRDKYALYDDVIKLKLNNNIITCENMQLKTRIKRLERELENKDHKIIGKIKKIEAQIHSSYQQDSDTKGENKSSPFPNKDNIKLEKLTYQTNLSMALRRQIQDQKDEIKQKDEELFHLKRDVRHTKHLEHEAENSILMNECVRLRAIIDQLFAQMGGDGVQPTNTEENSATPQRRERSKDDMIQNLLEANEQFQKVDQEKDHKIIEYQDQMQSLDSRLSKKIKELQENKRNHVKTIRTKNKEIQGLKSQIEQNKKQSNLTKSLEYKQQNRENLIKTEKELSRVKTDLKNLKKTMNKFKGQVSELEQEKKDYILEIKELKRRNNAYETKIDLLKKKEQSERSQHSDVPEKQEKPKSKKPENPYQHNPKLDGSYTKTAPEMKPIAVSSNKGNISKDNFEFDLDSDDRKEAKRDLVTGVGAAVGVAAAVGITQNINAITTNVEEMEVKQVVEKESEKELDVTNNQQEEKEESRHEEQDIAQQDSEPEKEEKRVVEEVAPVQTKFEEEESPKVDAVSPNNPSPKEFSPKESSPKEDPFNFEADEISPTESIPKHDQEPPQKDLSSSHSEKKISDSPSPPPQNQEHQESSSDDEKYESDGFIKEPSPKSLNQSPKAEKYQKSENEEEAKDTSLKAETKLDTQHPDESINDHQLNSPQNLNEKSDDEYGEDEFEQQNTDRKETIKVEEGHRSRTEEKREETSGVQGKEEVGIHREETMEDHREEQEVEQEKEETNEREETRGLEKQDDTQNLEKQSEARSKDDPIIEEEEVPQNQENPYHQEEGEEGEGDEGFEIDQVPDKPDINGEENLEQPQEGEGEGDLNLTDEEIFEIAENALLKVAHCFLIRGTTVTELFSNHIKEIQFEEHRIPIISPEIFVEGLRILEIENMTELELACLMNVLVKPQLENGILVEELESIIQNAPQILNMQNEGEGGEQQEENPPNVQNMLVLDSENDPNQAYNPYGEGEGMFGQNMEAPYHAHGDANLVPRDVIQEDENERTQDSAMIKITEEREDTKHASSNQDMNSQSSPSKPSPEGKNKQPEEDVYEDDYEPEEEPVHTKPFENTPHKEAMDQEEYLKMLANPADRPTTRNPRMQKRGDQSRESENRANEGSLGDMEKKENSATFKKIEDEIKGGFELPDDSDQ